MAHSVLEVLSHSEVLLGDNGLYVNYVAVIDEVVQVAPATQYTPPEYGPAVCNGCIWLADDDNPATEKEFHALAQQVDPWNPVDICGDDDGFPFTA